MKAFLILMTALSAAGGVAWGYLDHQRSRQAPPEARPAVEKVKPPAPPKESRPAPEPKESSPAPQPPPPQRKGPSQAELDAAIKKLETLILKEDFAAAAQVSGDLVQRFEKEPEVLRRLEKLRRAERKARAYAALIANLDTRVLPDPLYLVALANGNSLHAKTVKELPDAYEFEYVLGGKGSLTRDKVSSVTPLPRKTYLTQRWKEIRDKTAALKDPIELFFTGVRKCFRDGLRREGITLLDRLLAMPESGQVVAMYARDPEGLAVRHWEQAAGRAPLEPLTREEEVAIETVQAQAGGGGEETGDEPLRRAGEIIRLAEELFKKGETFEARTRVQSASKLLYSLPTTDERVRDLNRRAGELLEKVMKLSE